MGGDGDAATDAPRLEGHLREIHLHNWGITPMGGAGLLRRLSQLPFFVPGFNKQNGAEAMWTSTTQSELREIVWLASVVGALSILGTGLAVALAMVLVV
jgi:hypothetical protein